MRAVVLPVFAIAGAAALAVQLYAQSKPNFSGDWTMVPEKSSFGMMPTPTTMTRTITHKDPAVKVVTTQTGGALGDTTVETNFTTDGKPQANTVSGTPMSTVGAGMARRSRSIARLTSRAPTSPSTTGTSCRTAARRLPSPESSPVPKAALRRKSSSRRSDEPPDTPSVVDRRSVDERRGVVADSFYEGADAPHT
jgi:hypothetical protein